MEDSILKSTKKILGLDASYTAFDLDVATFINSALSTLNQLGVGPPSGLTIDTDGEATWTDFFGDDPRFNNIQTYVYLKVRTLFDPPENSFSTAAMQRQLEELEWRIAAVREGDDWVDPDPEVINEP